MTKTVQEYVEEIKATPRELLRRLILGTACNSLPPGALCELYNQLEDIGGKELCTFAPYYKEMTSPHAQKAMLGTQLVPKSIDKATQLYQWPSGELSEKRLYILFSGDTGQFFIPLALLLDYLPKGPKDVIVIRSGLERFYRFGVEGHGVSQLQIATSLKAAFNTGGYSHVTVMGFSAGGVFALRVADLLEADIGISFAGIYPDETPALAAMAKVGASAFDPLCPCRSLQAKRLVNVVSTLNELDCTQSFRIAKNKPQLIQYHLFFVEVHNVLERMVKTKTARIFLWMALHRNGIFLSVISPPVFWLAMLVRRARMAFGVQKLKPWW